MAFTLYGRSRDSSVLLGIMCHAACAFSLLIFTDRFPLWCFSLPSISRGLLVLQGRGPPAARTRLSRIIGLEPPGAFAPAGSRRPREPAAGAGGRHKFSAATGRGGADRARSGFIIVAIGEGDTPYSIGDTPMCRTHGRSPKTTGIVSSTRDRSPDPPAGPNTAPAVNVLKSAYVTAYAPSPTRTRPAWALGRYILIDNGR
jgi:hypothetical protein